MYTITEAYRAKMLDQVQTHRLVGTIDGISFTDADVIGVSYTNRCSDKNVSLGSVNIGVLKLTFLTDILDRGDYPGKVITISDGLLVGEDTYEDIPVGTFYVAEATWTAANMVSVVAYDCLSKMDEPLNLDQTTGKIYDFCSYIATETGTTFGMTQAECEALPNGLELLSPYEFNNMETWRDMVSALAQMVGGFAYAAKDGSWKLKCFDNTSVISVVKNRRMSGARFSDFQTYYDTLVYTEQENNIVHYVGDGEGLTINIGTNPFIQYGSRVAVERRALNIVEAIKEMRYTPYTVSMLPAFIALDLGDVISFTDDYTSDVSSGAIMELTWTYNKSFSVKSFGNNPNLRKGQSNTDKNISGLIKNTTENEVTYYNFANVSPITILPENETSIATLAFSSAQKTTVKILHEFLMDMLSNLSLNGSYELHYYYDDELVAYIPSERIGGLYGAQSGVTDFTICRDFFYVLRDVEPSVRHKWEVKILTHNIQETTIDTNHAHVTLEGQRMYGEEFYGGFIEAQDYLTLIPIGYLSLVNITDNVSLSVTDENQLVHPVAADDIALLDIGKLSLMSFTDSALIVMESIFPWAWEDGNIIATEDGNSWATE